MTYIAGEDFWALERSTVLLIRCWRCVSWQYFAAFCTVSVSSAKTKPTRICKANCIRMKARNYQKHSPCPSCRILGKAFHLHSIDRRCLGIPWRLSKSMPQDKLNHWTCWLFCCVVWCQTEVPTLCQPRNWQESQVLVGDPLNFIAESSSLQGLLFVPFTKRFFDSLRIQCICLSKEQWVEPFIDTSKWEYYDLSCKSRDETDDKANLDFLLWNHGFQGLITTTFDTCFISYTMLWEDILSPSSDYTLPSLQVLHDAVASGKRLGAIFKEFAFGGHNYELGSMVGEDFRWLARDLWKNHSSCWPRKSEVFLGLKDPKRTDFTIHNHVLKILTTCRHQKFFPLYQEPTITPTTEQASFEGESWKWRQKSERQRIQAVWQVKEFGLKKPFGSPNGAMRRRHTQALQHWSVSVVSLIVLFTDP